MQERAQSQKEHGICSLITHAQCFWCHTGGQPGPSRTRRVPGGIINPRSLLGPQLATLGARGDLLTGLQQEGYDIGVAPGAAQHQGSPAVIVNRVRIEALRHGRCKVREGPGGRGRH